MAVPNEFVDINDELSRLIIDPSDLPGSLDIIERAIERASIVLDAAKAMSSSPVLDQSLSSLTKAVVPRISDWWIIWLSEEPGGVFRRAAAFHADPAKKNVFERFAREAPSPGETIGPAFVMRSGKAELIQKVDVRRVNRLLARHRSPLSAKRHELLSELGVTSYMAVPTISENGTRLGVIAFGNTSSRRHLNEDDLNIGNEVASLVARAIKNAQVYENALTDADRLRFERESRNEFFYRQIHELRTLFTAVLLILDLVQRNVTDPKKVNLLTERAKDSILRVRTILVYDESEIKTDEPSRKAA